MRGQPGGIEYQRLQGSKAVTELQDSGQGLVDGSADGRAIGLQEGATGKQRPEAGKVEQIGRALAVENSRVSVGDTDSKLVGELKFHVSPEVVSHPEDDKKPGDVETVQIRHFIDAGWVYTREVRRLALQFTSGPEKFCQGLSHPPTK